MNAGKLLKAIKIKAVYVPEINKKMIEWSSLLNTVFAFVKYKLWYKVEKVYVKTTDNPKIPKPIILKRSLRLLPYSKKPAATTARPNPIP